MTKLAPEWVRTSDPYGPFGSSPIDVEALQYFLKHYDSVSAPYLIEGFTSGFQIAFEGSKPSNEPPNLISAKHHPEIVDNKIKKELSLNRISGPYDSPPFSEMVISPIGVIPKKQPGTFWMIHHLSYPRGLSINHGISKEHKRNETMVF